MSPKPKILCVDDELNVLEGMKINLRKLGQILTASSGAEGLKVLAEHADVAVVISDMRMPEMNGAKFLARSLEVRPDAVRILLTGYSDMEAAVAAVNEGQLFRFLTKPCPPDLLHPTVRAAIEQHRLVISERTLLQRTVLGSVRALLEVMSVDSPWATGRALRLRRHVRDAAQLAGIGATWPIELAAVFSQLGAVALPENVLQRLYDGHELSDQEARTLQQNVDHVVQIVEKIPRLEPAIELLKAIPAPGNAQEPLGLRIIRAALQAEVFEARGENRGQIIEHFRQHENVLGDDVIRLYEQTLNSKKASAVRQMLKISELQEGMVLLDDVVTKDEVLLVPRGLEITDSIREHLDRHMDQIGDKLVVVAGGASAAPPAEFAAEVAGFA